MGGLEKSAISSVQRLGNLLRIAWIGEDILADHAHRQLMKVGLQSLIKFGKLGPQDLVEKSIRRPDHDRVAPLKHADC
jgi:hypothetical protein